MSGRARTFHAKAWLLWLVAAAGTILAVDNPFVTVVALATLGLVAATFATSGPEGRSFIFFVKLGIVFTAIRLVLFGLTGHTGATVLFTLPRLELPGWLGGWLVGGAVTLEVTAQVVAEGLKIIAFLACFGVFLSVIETYRLLRLLPRFLFEAGLVVSIALAFVPTLLRTAADVRDAQRLRGHRFRGLRSLRPLVVPVLAGALERSLTLAASMEARGYGRHDAEAERAGAGARAVVLASLLGVVVGGGLFAYGAGPLAAVLAASSGAVLVVALRGLGSAAPRTRYRPDRLDRWDAVLLAVSGATLAAVPAARALEASRWYPYPVLAWPAADLRLIALALALAAPVAIAVLRDVSLRRAEQRHPVALEASP